jgi:nucleotide-binding universal stress UspA family protein
MTSYSVLVPVDANEERATAQAAHVASLPNASESVSATLLHVYPTVEGDAGTERLGDHMGRPDSLEKISQRLADNGIEVEVRKGEGDVADTILAVARDLEPDVIVMAGRKRSPVGKAVFGSTSQAVILNAAVAVTVVE